MVANDQPGVEHLVVGGDGMIGRAVCLELRGRGAAFAATSRRPGSVLHLDLRDVAAANLPHAEVIYLIAAMPKFAECEGNPTAWVVNVDAPIALARAFRHHFVVFVSSDSVEWSSAAYARHKAQVEAYIQSIGGAIIRPARVAPERAGELARVIVDAGLARKAGVSRWW